MVLFDIPFAFLAGGALGRRANGRRPDLAVLFAGLGVAMPGLAFLEVYPDWDWQYLLDPASLPDGASAAFAGACVLSGFLGHLLGHKHPKLLIGVAGALGVFLLATIHRTLHVGDRTAYLAGQAPLLPMDFLLFGGAWMSVSGVVLAYCIWQGEIARGTETQT